MLENAMRILITKRAVALVVVFAVSMMETCSLPLTAGGKPRSAPQAETEEGCRNLRLKSDKRGPNPQSPSRLLL